MKDAQVTSCTRVPILWVQACITSTHGLVCFDTGNDDENNGESYDEHAVHLVPYGDDAWYDGGLQWAPTEVVGKDGEDGDEMGHVIHAQRSRGGCPDAHPAKGPDPRSHEEEVEQEASEDGEQVEQPKGPTTPHVLGSFSSPGKAAAVVKSGHRCPFSFVGMFRVVV